MKLREYILCPKKKKKTVFNNYSPPNHVLHHYREYHDACMFVPLHVNKVQRSACIVVISIIVDDDELEENNC